MTSVHWSYVVLMNGASYVRNESLRYSFRVKDTCAKNSGKMNDAYDVLAGSGHGSTNIDHTLYLSGDGEDRASVASKL